MTLQEAIAEINQASPLMMEAESEQKVDGKLQTLKFPDSHLTTIAVSMGCLRAIREAYAKARRTL